MFGFKLYINSKDETKQQHKINCKLNSIYDQFSTRKCTNKQSWRFVAWR